MIDWAEVLDPERLGLGEQVREIHWLERTNMDGDPLIEVRVVLEPVPEVQWTWDLFGPIDEAIRAAVSRQTYELFPIVRFFVPEEWELFNSDEPLDDQEEPRYGVG